MDGAVPWSEVPDSNRQALLPRLTSDGAPDRNRTGTDEYPQDPQSCASTCSATEANGVPSRARTVDPLIKSQMLCQLS